jgi:hypothetical protein
MCTAVSAQQASGPDALNVWRLRVCLYRRLCSIMFGLWRKQA